MNLPNKEKDEEVIASIAAKNKEAEELKKKHPTFHKRSLVTRAVRSILRLSKAKVREVERKPWTWGFWELPDAKKVEPGRQIIRRALAKTAMKNLRANFPGMSWNAKYGEMDRKSLRILASALAKKTFKELSKEELVEMYRKAENLGRVI